MQFHLFAGDDYYPSGGMGDHEGAFYTLEDAQRACAPYVDWAHIVQIQDDGALRVVARRMYNEWTEVAP